MKPKLLIVTGSKLKFEDLAIKLNEFFDCEKRNWTEPEIQGSPDEIIRHKLKTTYQIFKQPVLVDDVSVSMEALNGFPGPYMKDFWKHFTPEELGKKFAGSRISATCRLGFCREEGEIIIAEGTFHGEIIAPKNNDHKGRDFELCVKLDGMNKIMLDCTEEERKEFFHRGKAMKNLLDILRKI